MVLEWAGGQAALGRGMEPHFRRGATERPVVGRAVGEGHHKVLLRPVIFSGATEWGGASSAED